MSAPRYGPVLRPARQTPDLHPIIQSIEALRVEAGVSMDKMSWDLGQCKSWWKMTLVKGYMSRQLYRVDQLLARFGHEIVIQEIEK